MSESSGDGAGDTTQLNETASPVRQSDAENGETQDSGNGEDRENQVSLPAPIYRSDFRTFSGMHWKPCRSLPLCMACFLSKADWASSILDRSRYSIEDISLSPSRVKIHLKRRKKKTTSTI